MTLVSVGPYNAAGFPLSGGAGAVFRALNELMVDAVGFYVEGKAILSQRPFGGRSEKSKSILESRFTDRAHNKTRSAAVDGESRLQM